ncbi:MAG TPA: DUF4383 domain-containing protein [Longimicrobiales bacterium]
MAERAPEFTPQTTPDRGRSTTIREEVRRGLEERPAVRPTVSPPMRTTAQRASLALGIASASFGALAFAAPIVAGNRDKVINLRNGKLFGVFAVNPPHALAHIGLGALGIASSRSAASARLYLGASSLIHGALAAAGFTARRRRRDIYEVMGLALNTADNVLHAAWSGAAALFASRPRLGQGI